MNIAEPERHVEEVVNPNTTHLSESTNPSFPSAMVNNNSFHENNNTKGGSEEEKREPIVSAES
jgi:hypothetical protein